MSSNTLFVTLALANEDERKKLERIISDMPMVSVQSDDAEHMGVLIYEPGPSAQEDFPHIFKALETGQADDVFLAGPAPDPELLISAMRHGIREFLRYPVVEEDFRSAIMRSAMRDTAAGGDAGGRLITVLGAKPGLGVTTVAVNLACALNAVHPGEVAVLDLRHPGGEIPMFLDLKHEYTWGELTDDVDRLDATYLKSAMAEHESGLFVLPAPDTVDRPEEGVMHLLLNHMRQVYPLCVADATLSDAALSGDESMPREVLDADDILLVTDFSMTALARTARALKNISVNDQDLGSRVRLVVNRYSKGAGVDPQEAEQVLGVKLDWLVPDDYQAALSAINQGIPFVHSTPRGPLAKVYGKMAEALAPAAEKAQEKKGFSLGSLFRRGKSEKNDEPVKAARAGV